MAGTLYGRVTFGSSGVPGTLAGTGTVVLGGYGSNNTLVNNSNQSGAAGTLTIGSGITVRGKNGQIVNQFANGTILNQGTISADVSGGIVVLGSSTNGSLINQGTLSAQRRPAQHQRRRGAARRIDDHRRRGFDAEPGQFVQ